MSDQPSSGASGVGAGSKGHMGAGFKGARIVAGEEAPVSALGDDTGVGGGSGGKGSGSPGG